MREVAIGEGLSKLYFAHALVLHVPDEVGHCTFTFQSLIMKKL
jgi:hypothetical protein